jgi:GT2 family glycosyltransferase
MKKRIDISVIVCTRNRRDDLVKFVESLCVQLKRPDELVIVDASDTGDTKKMLRAKRDQLPFHVIYKYTSPGLTRQRNLGVRLSSGNYLYFFDDDVVLEPEYINVVMETFAEHERDALGGVTGRITNIKGSPNLWDRAFKRIFFLSDFGNGKVKPSGFPSSKVDEKPSFVGLLSGCNMAYPKWVFSQFKFDEALASYSYMEDVDFSFRVGQKYPLYYQPRARLEHHPAGYRTYGSRELRRMMVQNHRYLFKKNQPQSPSNILSHWISILGVFIYNVVIQRDFDAGFGIVEGLRAPENVKEDL